MVTLRVKNKFRPWTVSDITPSIRVLEGGGTFMPGRAIAIPYILICSWKLLGLKGVILSIALRVMTKELGGLLFMGLFNRKEDTLRYN